MKAHIIGKDKIRMFVPANHKVYGTPIDWIEVTDFRTRKPTGKTVLISWLFRNSAIFT